MTLFREIRPQQRQSDVEKSGNIAGYCFFTAASSRQSPVGKRRRLVGSSLFYPGASGLSNTYMEFFQIEKRHSRQPLSAAPTWSVFPETDRCPGGFQKKGRLKKNGDEAGKRRKVLCAERKADFCGKSPLTPLKKGKRLVFLCVWYYNRGYYIGVIIKTCGTGG